jgi:pimeloyl-ACP methyl ester carboxylesterase
MEKVIIKNRKGQKISVIVDKAENAKGLAFVMHGLGGFKEQAHIEAFAETFRDKGYAVVRFDTTNTFGESDGNYQDATTTNYLEDLEGVIEWAKTQKWYQEPFILVGHSLGGFCSTLYAEKHPEKIKALAPISMVVSGKLWEGLHPRELMKKWKEEGLWNKGESVSKPGVMKILKWSFAEDIMQYDALEGADKLMMPVLLVVGSEDHGTPAIHQKMMFDKVAGKKELHIIDGAEHTFREQEHLNEIKQIFMNWIDKL